MSRRVLIAGVAGLALAVGAAPAKGAVILGQLAPPNSPSVCNDANPFDSLQPTVTSGNPYVVPSTVANGRITAWSTEAGPALQQTLTLKMWRPTGAANTYQVIGRDGPRPIAASSRNAFPNLNIPVKAGDILGLNDATQPVTCQFSAPGERRPSQQADTPLFQTLAFTTFAADSRLNILATVQPTNTFKVGKVKRNKKKGTAIQFVNVPNPGRLIVRGNSVKGASAGAAVSVRAPGRAKVKIRPKGKWKARLKRKGRVKLRTRIIYTPRNGKPFSRIRGVQVKLKR